LEKLLGFLKRGDGHLAAGAGKALQKFFECFSAFERVKQCLKWNASAAKNGCSPKNLRIFYDDVASRRRARVSGTSKYIILVNLDAAKSKPELQAGMRELDSDQSQFQEKKLSTSGRVLRLVDSFLDQVLEALSNIELRLPGWKPRS
jgi:hypothetical protein